MENGSFKKQEYSGFRQELTTIVQARYTILGLIMVGLGVVTNYVVTSAAQITSFASPFKIQLLSPYLYALLLMPGMLITYLLTVHYRRIDAYLWARYGSDEGLLFQSAYERFRSRGKFHPAYTEPLVWAYGIMTLFAVIISLFMNFDMLLPQQQYWQIPSAGIILLFLLFIVFWFATALHAGRILTRNYQTQWRDAIDYVKRQPSSTNAVAVFLDRDGVINENKEAGVTSLSLFRFIPKAKAALFLLSRKGKGFSLIVVTNQPYIGNGQMTVKDLEKIHEHMEKEIWKAGGYIQRIYTCPHSENSGCSCRKPNTQLFKQAAEELNINLKDSWVIGDQMSDIDAGNRIGARTILVLTGEGERAKKESIQYPPERQPCQIVRDVKEAVELILKEA